jgi:hypothetical protein
VDGSDFHQEKKNVIQWPGCKTFVKSFMRNRNCSYQLSSLRKEGRQGRGEAGRERRKEGEEGNKEGRKEGRKKGNENRFMPEKS